MQVTQHKENWRPFSTNSQIRQSETLQPILTDTFDVTTAVTMNITAFWVVVLSGQLEIR